MAKAHTTETRAAKVAAQEKIVARLTARRDKASKTLAAVEGPLRFEQARLLHIQTTPVVDEDDAPQVDAPGSDAADTAEAVAQDELSFA